MKMKCEVIRDLFPSYIDGLTSQESNAMIQEHLEECQECRKFLEDMKEDITEEDWKEKNKEAIKPFRKLRQRSRRKLLLTAGAAVAACGLIFGGGILYYETSWTADSKDVKMTVEAEGGIATLRFAPEKDHRRLYAEVGEDNTIRITEKRQSPFAGNKNPNAYWSCTFIDENTAMSTGGEGIAFAQDQELTIEYKDKTERVSLGELARKALENPLAESEDVDVTWNKEDAGTVTLGFFPELMGVSLKVEEVGENNIRIRQYYDGEGDPMENGTAYTLHFLDEKRLQRKNGEIQEISGDEIFTIEYGDKKEEILLKDLWKGNLPENGEKASAE